MPRPRVLLAPVTVTPTKPLTPSHLKGLFWTDIAFRATAQLADVTYRYSHTTYHPTEQTVGFWEYLDRMLGDTDYSTCSEQEIGELYVRYRAEGERRPVDALRPYLDAIERHGWTHPASARVLRLWTGHYRRLGLHDPGLTEVQPPGLGLDETVAALAGLGMCVDLREHGGPVYLDGTEHGIPLRRIVAADGRPNYLACALRELIPLAAEHDEIVLLYDRGLEPDYLLLQRVLSRLGPAVHRLPLGRVPVDGAIRSARHGGWQGCTAGELLDAAARHDEPVVRLGMRLYFVAMLGPGEQESFRHDLLHRWLDRAERLLDGAPVDGAAVTGAPVDGAASPSSSGSTALAGFLGRHRGDHSYVDPYRLASGLLGRRRPGSNGTTPLREVLAAVFT